MIPRITFGMIVLNGEPFIRYNLDSIYPFAHQIIIVEGACTAAKSVATPDGHSVDGTLELLRRYAAENDPEHKLTIVTAKDEGYADGFWPEKNEMCWAYARRITGDYLWQIDSDEFYRSADIEKVMNLANEGVDAISFPTLHFFGDLKYRVEGFRFICDRYEEYHRFFKWGKSYKYTTHRPPTVIDEQGVDVRKKNWVNANRALGMNIRMYHYCYLFPHQVLKKAAYYSTQSEAKNVQHGGYIQGADRWATEVYMNLIRPYRMFIKENSICWLERWGGGHPTQVVKMMEDVQNGRIHVETRRTEDIERLLSRPSYRINCAIMNLCARGMDNHFGRLIRCYAQATMKYLSEGTLISHARKFICRILGRFRMI